MWSTPYYRGRPGADLGAIWRRKRSKDPFLSTWIRLRSIWDLFLINSLRQGVTPPAHPARFVRKVLDLGIDLGVTLASIFELILERLF